MSCLYTKSDLHRLVANSPQELYGRKIGGTTKIFTFTVFLRASLDEIEYFINTKIRFGFI